MEYKNIFDFYNFKDSLGKGKFGVVNLAVHKKTGKHFAIKIVKKANMKPIEMI
jgi:serine/threonine protein kinase